jgi:histidine kinase
VSWWRRLDVRLFVSYAAVVTSGVAALLVTIRLLVPRLFDRRLRAGAGRGVGPETHDALISALNRALVVAVLVSLAIAVPIAIAAARRVLGPIDRVRAATRRIAAGRYDETIETPREPELAGLAADVNGLARALADTERRRAQLVSDVTHELRSPLTTIRGYAEGMVDGIVAPDDDVLTAILREVGRLERLASDLGTLSRVDAGVLALDRRTIDLFDVAKQAVAGLQTEAARRQVDVAVHGSTAVPVAADRDRIAQVLSNLLANALAYTPADGRVDVDVASDTTGATITVTDTGIGLAGDDVERVFDRFYRVQGVDRPPGGSGIGLAIVRAIVRAHGGDVTASSPGPGRGATFTVRLPGA